MSAGLGDIKLTNASMIYDMIVCRVENGELRREKTCL